MIDVIKVFLLSMTPVGELRMSIPIGIAVFDLNVYLVFFVSVLGNLIPAIFILLFLKKISVFFEEKCKIWKKFILWWENRTKKNHSKKIQRYGFMGLALLVAIPLPITGAYTGALLATLMGLTFKKSLFAIFTGIVVAGIIVSFIVILGINMSQYLGWQLVFGFLFFSSLLFWYFKKAVKKQI
jgi:uncharacterized membrane protein